MSTVEDRGLRVDIEETVSGACLVPGERLPAHIVVVADWLLDLEPYGDGELSDAALLAHAELELLDAQLDGIEVPGTHRRCGRWPDVIRRRQRRRLARAAVAGTARGWSDRW